MPTCSFRDLKKALQKLGLEPIEKKNGTNWEGISPLNHQLVQIVIHEHASGRDVPTGTLRKYIRDLGFKNFNDFLKYLSQIS